MHQEDFKQLKKQFLHGVHEKRWTVFGSKLKLHPFHRYSKTSNTKISFQ